MVIEGTVFVPTVNVAPSLVGVEFRVCIARISHTPEAPAGTALVAMVFATTASVVRSLGGAELPAHIAPPDATENAGRVHIEGTYELGI